MHFQIKYKGSGFDILTILESLPYSKSYLCHLSQLSRNIFYTSLLAGPPYLL